jgi:hypothetical protein
MPLEDAASLSDSFLASPLAWGFKAFLFTSVDVFRSPVVSDVEFAVAGVVDEIQGRNQSQVASCRG